jgi:hypothetical protein
MTVRLANGAAAPVHCCEATNPSLFELMVESALQSPNGVISVQK